MNKPLSTTIAGRIRSLEPVEFIPPQRIYIAGPMSGYPDLNFPAFHAKAAELRAAGYVVINPAEINGGADELVACASMTPTELQAHWQKCMRKDITELCTCDGIAMLDGWTQSKGATLEHHVARALGLVVFEAVPAAPEVVWVGGAPCQAFHTKSGA